MGVIQNGMNLKDEMYFNKVCLRDSIKRKIDHVNGLSWTIQTNGCNPKWDEY